ncbi:hypothetical protein [Novosphingobium sp.]|uniref:hypothetical protein n=1 Tax=Novosphingobium sp. TaxID=1874826 RepID=UPI00261D4AD8|nr:hypothetical protein [Novosphingobium sp.]
MMIVSVLMLAASVAGSEPLYTDDQLGLQMSVAEMKRDLIGNTLAWDSPAGPNALHLTREGALKGKMAKSGSFTIAWRFRDYDNLLCADSGDPASSGCVQVLRKGNRVSFRRKDGLVEFTASLIPGNPSSL